MTYSKFEKIQKTLELFVQFWDLIVSGLTERSWNAYDFLEKSANRTSVFKWSHPYKVFSDNDVQVLNKQQIYKFFNLLYYLDKNFSLKKKLIVFEN